MSHLKRSIYVLKQFSRSWSFKYHETITSFGLSIVSYDYCLYVKRITDGIMFLTLYVDDILLVVNKLEMIEASKE